MAMKIIDFETIRNLSISPADCVKWVETALRMKYDSCLPHKISMTIEPDVFFNTMPSYLPSCGRFGVKVVSRFPKREPALVSDILLYDADYVPVGVDQKQHVELTRDLAERFNHRYGDTFTVPEPLVAKVGAKVYSLQDPRKKMSKSEDNPKGTIDLLDEPSVARKKIMSAVTDSIGIIQYDPEQQPGISNLLTILSSLNNEAIEDIVARYAGKGYGEFKKEVGECVYQFLTQLQSKYKEIIASGMVEKVITEGNDKARQIAHKKIMKVKKKVGFQLF